LQGSNKKEYNNYYGGAMTKKKVLKVELVFGLFLLGIGGWLLHLRIHPPAGGISLWIPFISGMISVFFIPLFFCFRPTVTLGYIVNGFLAIIGTITMAQFSLAHLPAQLSVASIILNTTLADIAVLWGKFTIGKALFDLELLKSDTDSAGKGRFFRYPNMGWWWAHLLSIAFVYALGNIILR